MLKESSAMFCLKRDDVLVSGDINSTCPKKAFPRSDNSKVYNNKKKKKKKKGKKEKAQLSWKTSRSNQRKAKNNAECWSCLM